MKRQSEIKMFGRRATLKSILVTGKPYNLLG